MTKLMIDSENQDYVEHMMEMQIPSTSLLNNVSVYVSNKRADIEARELSKMMPGKSITVRTMSRIKAVYTNGERVRVFDYKDFYSNLTEEQIKSTLIWCSDENKLI